MFETSKPNGSADDVLKFESFSKPNGSTNNQLMFESDGDIDWDDNFCAYMLNYFLVNKQDIVKRWMYTQFYSVLFL